MLVNFETFKGQNKAIPNHMLPIDTGQYANNMYIEDGRFVPMFCTSFASTSNSFTGNEQTLYKHRNVRTGTEKWFTSNSWTPVARHPNGSDTQQRLYFIENSRPKYKLYDTSYVYDLLMPAINPQDKMTVKVSGGGPMGVEGTLGSRHPSDGAIASFNNLTDVAKQLNCVVTTKASTSTVLAAADTYTVTLTSTPVVDHGLIAIISYRQVNGSGLTGINNITQTSNTWTNAVRTPKHSFSMNETGIEIWYCNNLGSDNSIDITFNCGGHYSVIVLEYDSKVNYDSSSYFHANTTSIYTGYIVKEILSPTIYIGGMSFTYNPTPTIITNVTSGFTEIDHVVSTYTDDYYNTKLYVYESKQTVTGNIKRFLAYTFVNDFGDESSLSFAENGSGKYAFGNYFIENLSTDSYLTVTWNVPTFVPSGGNYNNKITKVRFYMTPTESTSSGYRFIGEALVSDEFFQIANAGTDAPLQEVLTSPVKLTYEVFGDGTGGSVNNPCVSVCKTMFGSLIISDKANIYVSDIYKPSDYNVTNMYSVDNEITGVFPFGSSIAVFTKTTPSIFTGNGPSTLTVEKAEQARAVSNIKCVVNTDDYIVFPTDEGIYVVGTGVYKLATDGVISKRQWEDMTQKGSLLLSATHYKDQYILLLTNGVAYIFDFLRGFFSQTVFANNSFTTSGNYVVDKNILKTSYYDSVDQQLYSIPTGVSGNNIYTYEGSDNQLTGTFKSKRFISNKPFNMKYLRVLADDFTDATVTVKIYYDGVLFQTVSVTSDKVLRVASKLSKEMEIEIQSNVTLRSILLSDNIKEIQSV